MKAIAVRDLAAFVFRAGDLYSSGEGGRVEAWEGTAAHTALQQQRSAADQHYRKEVAIKLPITLLGDQSVLQGRIDGLTRNPHKQPVVEEYKTSRSSSPALRPADEAQAWLYAGMLCSVDPSVATVTTRTIYIDPQGVELATYEHALTADQAVSFLAFVLTSFNSYLQRLNKRHRQRQQWAADLSFPYPSYRKNQRAMAGQVYSSVVEAQNLLLEAVTGSGKTMGILYPAIKAQGLNEQFFFLTSRTRGADAALDALEQLIAKDCLVPLRAVQITAKEKTCPLEQMTCDPALCPNAADYYSKVPKALSALDQHPLARRSVIESIAAEHAVCPFELSLDSATTADIIIGDYNYVFDPNVRLQRFVHQGHQSLLIDEAHQLSHRVNDMLTVTLTADQLNQALAASRHDLRPALQALQAALNRTSKSVLSRKGAGVKPSQQGYLTCVQSNEESKILDRAMLEFLQACEAAMSDAKQSAGPQTPVTSGPDYETQAATQPLFPPAAGPEAAAADVSSDPSPGSSDHNRLPEEALELYFAALAWHRSDKWTDNNHHRDLVTVQQYQGKARVKFRSIRRQCIDSSHYCAQIMSDHRAVIRFSGTLSPLNLFQRVHGQVPPNGDDSAEANKAVRAQTPFHPEQLGVFAIADIDTFYQQRQRSLPALHALLKTLQEARPGRYLVAMPSYEYLAQLGDHADADEWFLQQTRSMDDAEQLALLKKFQSADQAVLGIVMGGVFSESVDLGAGALSGVVVVSLGLPPKDLAKDLIQQHFDDVHGAGWGRHIAYLQPALSRTVQAAGRLIRGPGDRGVLCLVDPRFGSTALQNYYPEHWRVQVTATNQLSTRLKTFWSHDLPNRGD